MRGIVRRLGKIKSHSSLRTFTHKLAMMLEALGGLKDSRNNVNWIFGTAFLLSEERIGRWKS